MCCFLFFGCLKILDKQSVHTFGDVIAIQKDCVYFSTHAFVTYSFIYAMHMDTHTHTFESLVAILSSGTIVEPNFYLYTYTKYLYRITSYSIGIILLFCRFIRFVMWFSHSVLVQILFRERLR